MPVAGNHEYETARAAGYFGYFGRRRADRRASTTSQGNWRIFSLAAVSTSPPEPPTFGPFAKRCIAAFCTSHFALPGRHGSIASVAPLWQAMYDIGADLVLNVHDHSYQRFAELDRPTAPSRRMREIVVGTGGSGHYTFGTPVPASQVRDNTSFG